MWEAFFETCVRVLGLTARPRSELLVAACLLVGALGALCLYIWGFAGLLTPAMLVLVSGGVALQVVEAREAAWRAALLSLDDPRQPPAPLMNTPLLTPTAETLHLLGVALDDARRGRFAAAHEALPRINRALLRADEARLLDAVRALISLGLGDTHMAAQQALTAIPTGSDELDANLGRALITDSWHRPDRLRVIEAAWDRAGISSDQDSTLARLHRLTRLRIDARLLQNVNVSDARTLSTEARAVGDEDLAADLEARARASAYR